MERNNKLIKKVIINDNLGVSNPKWETKGGSTKTIITNDNWTIMRINERKKSNDKEHIKENIKKHINKESNIKWKLRSFRIKE